MRSYLQKPRRRLQERSGVRITICLGVCFLLRCSPWRHGTAFEFGLPKGQEQFDGSGDGAGSPAAQVRRLLSFGSRPQAKAVAVMAFNGPPFRLLSFFSLPVRGVRAVPVFVITTLLPVRTLSPSWPRPEARAPSRARSTNLSWTEGDEAKPFGRLRFKRCTRGSPYLH